MFAATVRNLALAFALAAPLATATTCKSTEFWYSQKSCCLPSGGPKVIPSAPTGKSCPTNFYWYTNTNCCVPKTLSATTVTDIICNSNLLKWSSINHWCSDNDNTSTTVTCKSTEFFWLKTNVCLPVGGPSSYPSPPSGSSCPSTHWWSSSSTCCVPKNPSPPATPSCSSGYSWNDASQCCKSSTPQPSHRVKRANHAAKSLCPTNMTACIISALGGDYDCVDPNWDQEACGGCPGAGGHDCTAIEGAVQVGCQIGACKVYTCAPGYKIAKDGGSCEPVYLIQ